MTMEQEACVKGLIVGFLLGAAVVSWIGFLFF